MEYILAWITAGISTNILVMAHWPRRRFQNQTGDFVAGILGALAGGVLFTVFFGERSRIWLGSSGPWVLGALAAAVGTLIVLSLLRGVPKLRTK